MIHIAHRGNIFGKTDKENDPCQIDMCINKGFHVEIDLWIVNDVLFLGHDNPQYEIEHSYLETRSEMLWIHCKNESALYYLQDTNFNYFWHQEDDFTLTSKGYIWTYPNRQKKYNKNQIILNFTDLTKETYDNYKTLGIKGVCSDNFSNIINI